jgi:hypothetical protein
VIVCEKKLDSDIVEKMANKFFWISLWPQPSHSHQSSERDNCPIKVDPTIVATLFHNHTLIRRVQVLPIFRITNSPKQLEKTTQLPLTMLVLFDLRQQYNILLEVSCCQPTSLCLSLSSNAALAKTAIFIYFAQTVALSDAQSDC